MLHFMKGRDVEKPWSNLLIPKILEFVKYLKILHNLNISMRNFKFTIGMSDDSTSFLFFSFLFYSILFLLFFN